MIREFQTSKFNRFVDKFSFGIIVVLAIGAGLCLLYFNRNLWFTGDDFSIIFDRYFHSKDSGLVSTFLKPHNEHPIVIPTIVFLLIENTFGLHHYWIFMVPVILMHVVVTICVGVLLSKVLNSQFLAITGAAAVAFASAGVENLFWAFQFGFVCAVACGLIQLILIFGQSTVGKRDYWGALFAIFAVLNPATALTSLFVVGSYLAIRRRWQALLIAIGPAVTLFLSWRVFFGSDENHPKPEPHQLLGLHQYVWKGLVTSSDGLLHLSGLGVMVLIAIGTYCVLQNQRSDKYALVAALMLGLVFFYLVNGLGRIQYGIDQAGVSRYTYIGVILLVIPAVVVIDFIIGSKKSARVLAHILLSWFIVTGAMEFLSHSRFRELSDRERFGNMSAAIELSYTYDVRLDALPSPTLDPNVPVGKLLQAEEEGLWPAKNFRKKHLIDTANRVTLNLVPSAAIDSNPSHRVSGYINIETPIVVDSCVQFQPLSAPQVIISPEGDEPLLLSSRFGSTLNVMLQTKKGLRSIEVTYELLAGQTYSITGWLSESDLVLNLPDNSPVTVCGVQDL